MVTHWLLKMTILAYCHRKWWKAKIKCSSFKKNLHLIWCISQYFSHSSKQMKWMREQEAARGSRCHLLGLTSLRIVSSCLELDDPASDSLVIPLARPLIACYTWVLMVRQKHPYSSIPPRSFLCFKKILKKGKQIQVCLSWMKMISMFSFKGYPLCLL